MDLLARVKKAFQRHCVNLEISELEGKFRFYKIFPHHTGYGRGIEMMIWHKQKSAWK